MIQCDSRLNVTDDWIASAPLEGHGGVGFQPTFLNRLGISISQHDPHSSPTEHLNGTKKVAAQSESF